MSQGTPTYAGERLCYDADSHIMELSDWVSSYADPGTRERLRPWGAEDPMKGAMAAAEADYARRRNDERAAMSADASILDTKLWAAIGAFDPSERGRALDRLGFRRQLVFPTGAPSQFQRNPDADVRYGGARAYNRAMADFCRTDERLMGVGYVPLDEPERSVAEVDAALCDGIAAVLIDTVPSADGPSATHPDHDGFWARLQEARVPCVLHVSFGFQPNGDWRTVAPGFYRNGIEMQNRFKGEAAEPVDAYGMTAVAHPAEMALATFVFDGLLERFPDLKVGCIEQTAAWVPSWLRHIDVTFDVFRAAHPHFSELSLRPSDYIRRQVKFTPFVFEPVDWLIEQGGEELFMFSSDYPHNEGGRDPIGGFEQRLGLASDDARHRFYAGNFAELFSLDDGDASVC